MGATRVLVVDDSVVVRRVLRELLEAEDDLEVVGTAANGRIAIEEVVRLSPDVVTLDVEMPVMDGLATLRELRDRGLRPIVIMFSTLTERGAAATLDAVQLGAADYVTKPSGTAGLADAAARVRDDLLPKIRALVAPAVPTATGVPRRPRSLRRAARVDVVAIGASTGGPNALTAIVGDLPADLPVPVLLVQHMPPVFTGLLARRLDGLGGPAVVEAEDGMPIEAGVVHVAPGDHHLVIDDRGAVPRLALHQGPPEHSCRPAVDPLFRSVASVHGDRALGVVLTGMGVDGLDGARALRAAGAEVWVQDAATSVVWGMPGAVAGAGLADDVLALDEVAPALRARLARLHAPLPAGGRS